MLNIHYAHGDMFDSNCAILVNAVNCKGVMGAGLALQFKNRYPVMFEKYKKQCQKGLLKPGGLDEHLIIGDPVVRVIVNFATKDDWKKNSEYSYIEKGMSAIVRRIQLGVWDDYLFGNYSIAIPALGCGLGGLQWTNVKEIITKALDLVVTPYDWNVYLYEPT